MMEKQPFEYAIAFCLPFPQILIYSARIRVKPINNSYHVEKIFTVDIPALQHGTDGLIYTCVTEPYTPGTDKNM